MLLGSFPNSQKGRTTMIGETAGAGMMHGVESQSEMMKDRAKETVGETEDRPIEHVGIDVADRGFVLDVIRKAPDDGKLGMDNMPPKQFYASIEEVVDWLLDEFGTEAAPVPEEELL